MLGKLNCHLQGLVDAHVHILFGGCSLQQIDLRYVTSKADFILEVQKAAGEVSVLVSGVSFALVPLVSCQTSH